MAKEIPAERVEMYGVDIPASIFREVPEQVSSIQIELLRYLTCRNVHDVLSMGEYETGFPQNKPGEDGREIGRLESVLLVTPPHETLKVLRTINETRFKILRDLQRVYKACQAAGIPWSRPAYVAFRKKEPDRQAQLPHTTNHTTFFGSWNEACRRAGLPLNNEGRKKRVTEEEVLCDLEKILKIFLRDNTKATPNSFIRSHYLRLGGKFGDLLINSSGFWRKFLLRNKVRRLGPPSVLRISDEQLKTALLKVACYVLQVTNPPKNWPRDFHLSVDVYRRYAKQCRAPAENTLLKRFGGPEPSWDAVLKACGIP